MRVLSYIIPLITIVIVDPYKGLRYDRITTYHISPTYRKLTITVIEGDGQSNYYPESESSSYYPEEETYPEVDPYYYDNNGPYFEPSTLYNTSPSRETYYFMKLFDYYSE